MKERTTTGEQLTTLRIKAGMTKYALAKKAGVAPSAVTLWEQGQHEPSFATMVKLIKAMGFEVVVRPGKQADAERKESE